METAEELRRKHIRLLEALQKLSDDNTKLRDRLEGQWVGGGGGGGGEDDGKEDVIQATVEMREEIKEVRAGRRSKATTAYLIFIRTRFARPITNNFSLVAASEPGSLPLFESQGHKGCRG